MVILTSSAAACSCIARDICYERILSKYRGFRKTFAILRISLSMCACPVEHQYLILTAATDTSILLFYGSHGSIDGP